MSEPSWFRTQLKAIDDIVDQWRVNPDLSLLIRLDIVNLNYMLETGQVEVIEAKVAFEKRLAAYRCEAEKAKPRS